MLKYFTKNPLEGWLALLALLIAAGTVFFLLRGFFS
jgi:hypothetical protein